MTKRLVVLSLAGLALLASVNAEPEHPVQPLLWKVEGPGVDKPAYLFGTMHVGGKALVTLHPAAEKAFKESTVVHTEAPLDMTSQLASMAEMMRKDGTKLNESIGEELAKRLNGELQRINPELDATPFQPMKTWFVAYSLPFLPEQLAGVKPLDLVLWERAEEAGKKTAGMQEIKDQVSGFNELSEAEQTRFMVTTLDHLEKSRREGRDFMKEAAEIYLTGDEGKINALAEQMIAEMMGGKDEPFARKLMQRILTDRDRIMADYIANTLKKDPAGVHFFAAGAAHYTGDNGVRSHLEKKGFKISRITE